MAESIESEREKKQIYLRDEIISGGYDPTEFKQFLDNIKAEGNISSQN